MNTKIIFFATFLSILALACDEKKEITQALCESQTNRADCEAAGCTYTCGMVLVANTARDCQARRKIGRCLAVVKLFDNAVNNQDYYYSVEAGQTGWFLGRIIHQTIDGIFAGSFDEYFQIKNPHHYRVEVLGHRPYVMIWEDTVDPCTMYDPDGTLFPWEGSCETDWWSETMWDDVLPE